MKPQKSTYLTLISQNRAQKEVTAQIENAGFTKIRTKKIHEIDATEFQSVAPINFEDAIATSKALKKKYPQFDFIPHSGQFIDPSKKKLLCIDMDSTTIQIEVIDEIARFAGIENEIKAITELAMNGKIGFDESIRKRVALLKGIEFRRLDTIELPLTDGARTFFATLKKNGFHLALLTGGFNIFAEKVSKMLSIDEYRANELEISPDFRLTGNLKGSIINAEKKAALMLEIAHERGIAVENILSVGDGANDIPMLQNAGLGIAFNAKEKTRELAPTSTDIVNLEAILLAIGIDF